MSTAKSPQQAPETDGRKLRTNDSRKKIVDAFLKLVYEGNISPSAEEVASTANVGLRTVFRRFNEMELLYRELIIEVQARHLPTFLQPFTSSEWREQLNEMIDRKASAYELLMPYRMAAKIYQHQSEFIKDNIARWNFSQRKMLELVLPFSSKKEPLKFAAIEVALSFDTWIQLRNEQKMSAKKSKQLMIYMMEIALGSDDIKK